jgi:hypothetical protein
LYTIWRESQLFLPLCTQRDCPNVRRLGRVAVLAATFIGVFTLLVTALSTALLSGGLLLAPILAALMVTATR